MAKNLVIVESPTKAKTIQKFLSGLKDTYIVRPCFGHIRDLPENEFGVDIEEGFKPKYVILPKAKKTIANLKKYLKETQKTILATDEDREGEAIAWHLIKALDLEKLEKEKKIKVERIVFHEITKKAIKEALKTPRKIDMRLVEAQKARRILDRLLGYKLSPFLWEKVAPGLSAGRVQSVALRLICEREKERENFKPEKYFIIEGIFKKKKDKFKARLEKIEGKKIKKPGLKDEKEAKKIKKDLEKRTWRVKKVQRKERIQNPPPPFTTSLLQQEAWRRFYFPAKFTMKIAQALYEKGYITYHRTDSFNLSQESLFSAKKVIEEMFGKEYWAGFFRKYKTKSKLSQEAHEAIRPTFPKRTPQALKGKLKKEEYKLYKLIWERFIATQMTASKIEETKVEIEDKEEQKYIFGTRGEIIKFEGYLKVYPYLKIKENLLPDLQENEKVLLSQIKLLSQETKPPPRYTEATLVKTLEKNGIGRPSTYAPIISTIQERGYVKKDNKKRLYPTEIGKVVSELLTTHFPEVVDINFTAKMEEDLDRIAKGEIDWKKPLETFYFPFIELLKKKEKEISKKEIMEEKTDQICPRCKSPLVIRIGKYGKFFACSNFPKCSFTKNFYKKTGILCPKCKKGEIVERKGKNGKTFYACSLFPKCDFISWQKPK